MKRVPSPLPGFTSVTTSARTIVGCYPPRNRPIWFVRTSRRASRSLTRLLPVITPIMFLPAGRAEEGKRLEGEPWRATSVRTGTRQLRQGVCAHPGRRPLLGGFRDLRSVGVDGLDRPGRMGRGLRAQGAQVLVVHPRYRRAITLLAMIFIQNVALAWIILIGWGLVRDSPYPLLYAAVMHRPRLRLLRARADDRPRPEGLGIFSPAA